MARARPGTSMRSSVNVDMTGPFFRADPEKTVMENIQKFMQGLADEGAKAARAGLSTGSSRRAMIRELGDRVADHVIGRTSALSGKRWMAAAVVQVSQEGFGAVESRSLMAAASSVERRTAAIRRVARSINANKADFTKGLD